MSLLKKFFKSVTSTERDEQKEDIMERGIERNQNLPLDERFIQNFKLRGGRFLYATDEEQVQQYFDNILLEHDLYEQKALVYDQSIPDRFNDYNLEFLTHADKDCKVFITCCHFMIADKGTLLFSSRQIKGLRIPELPEFFIVLARTSQIVENQTEALQKIKHGVDQIPSNITPLENFQEQNDDSGSLMKYGTSGKLTYLLMIEDL